MHSKPAFYDRAVQLKLERSWVRAPVVPPFMIIDLLKGFKERGGLEFKVFFVVYLEFDHDLIFITESWRSQERQNYLYSLGRTIPGKTVTWTKDSEHTK
ncbi:MAG: hypothetical protein Q8S84_08935 [bacterium]|nr:hypothetical protein [bacterium]MDP3381551.1 hypothetical protein [bacterium]